MGDEWIQKCGVDQQAFEDQTGIVEAALQKGLEGVEKQFRAVAAVLERIALNTARQAVPPPPPTFSSFSTTRWIDSASKCWSAIDSRC